MRVYALEVGCPLSEAARRRGCRRQKPASSRRAGQPSIAVLPFQNMSGDAEQDFFCDGMVEDIITALSKLARLRRHRPQFEFVYKGRSVDVREVATQLGVRYVLEGSVRKAAHASGSPRSYRRGGRHPLLGRALRSLHRRYFRNPGRDHARPRDRDAGQAHRRRTGAAALYDDEQCRGLDPLGQGHVLLPSASH